MKLRLRIWLIIFLLCAARQVHGGSVQIVKDAETYLKSHPPQWSRQINAPFCGVYSICLALKANGYDCDPSNFASVEYVSSARGSTPAELVAIARAAKADARIVSGVTAWDLKLLACPIVANVRSTPSSSSYDHWVLAEWKNGDLLVYDRLQPARTVAVADFLAIWNGLGIVVSKPDEDVLMPVWVGRLAVIQGALLLVIGFLFLGRRLRDSSLWAQFSVICLATMAVSGVGMVVFGDVRHFSSGARLAVAPHQENAFGVATLADLHQAAQSQEHLLVDARLTRDYGYGTLPHATNIPVTASMWEIQERMNDVDRAVPIIVFCQSQSCAYSHTIAGDLAMLGFKNIAVAEAGWREYQQAYSVAAQE